MLVAVLPLLGALVGGWTFFETMVSATSAPQQAAGMAMACAWAILPYVFAKSVEMLQKPSGRTVQPMPVTKASTEAE